MSLVDTVSGDYNNDVTDTLLKALKGRVSGMNVVGFFLAGSGRKGAVSRNTWYYLLMGGTITADAARQRCVKTRLWCWSPRVMTSITFFLAVRLLASRMMVWMTSWSALPRVNSRLPLPSPTRDAFRAECFSTNLLAW